jgi:hypothetical protein
MTSLNAASMEARTLAPFWEGCPGVRLVGRELPMPTTLEEARRA